MKYLIVDDHALVAGALTLLLEDRDPEAYCTVGFLYPFNLNCHSTSFLAQADIVDSRKLPQ